MSKPKSTINKKISEALCFHGEGFSIKCMHDALAAYKAGLKKPEDWLYHDDTPIFLDTNILLNVYMAAIPERDNFIIFLRENKERVYITHRVQQEFDKHRLPFIDKYLQTLTVLASGFRKSIHALNFQPAKLVSDLHNAVVKEPFIDSLPQAESLVEEIQEWIDTHSPFVDEYTEIQKKINDALEVFNKEYDVLYEKASLEYSDPLLEELSQVNHLPELTLEEIEFTKAKYNTLLARYDAKKSERANYLRFPGSGENKEPEKKEEPWGDLLIYHEIISYMTSSSRNAILLTNDSSKLDWMKKDGEPYSYYIADAYKNTGKILYIIKFATFFADDYIPSEINSVDEDSIGLSATATSIGQGALLTAEPIEDFKDITEEEFLTELKQYSEIKSLSPIPDISKSSFILNRLGKKGYRYSKSFKTYIKLRGTKIEEYEVQRDDHTIKCIRLKER